LPPTDNIKIEPNLQILQNSALKEQTHKYNLQLLQSGGTGSVSPKGGSSNRDEGASARLFLSTDNEEDEPSIKFVGIQDTSIFGNTQETGIVTAQGQRIKNSQPEIASPPRMYELGKHKEYRNILKKHRPGVPDISNENPIFSEKRRIS
jgi:hypothetical protein